MTMETTNTKRSKLDAMLAAAKARMDQKNAGTGPTTVGEQQDAVKSSAPSPTPKKREEATAQILAERERRLKEKTEKEAEKAAAKLRKEAEKAQKAETKATGSSHMKKVDKAAGKLPKIDDATRAVLEQVLSAALSPTQRATLAAHVLHQNRVDATTTATHSKPLPLGADVRITGGDPKFVGLEGKVVHSHKLRAKVEVPGYTKPVYIYTGEAEVIVIPPSDPIPE
jgi:hypothetical protein